MNAPELNLRGEEQPALGWSERNQQWLAQQFRALRARLETLTPVAPSAEAPAVGVGNVPDDRSADPDDDFTPALDRCADIFALSPFERELLLLLAGIELDAGVRRAVARAQAAVPESGHSTQPTFSLALSVLAEPHWDALSPLAPLRRWRLIELEGRRAPAQQPLHIDERILHYLTGVAARDERLSGLAHLVAPGGDGPGSTVGQRIARRLMTADGRVPLVVLTPARADYTAVRDAAMQGLDAAGSVGLWLQARDLPGEARELADMALLADRETALVGAMTVIELDPANENFAEQEQRAISFVARLLGPVLLLGTPEPSRLARLAQRRIFRVTVPEPSAPQLQALALDLVPAAAADAFADALRPALRQFQLPAGALTYVIEQVLLDEPDDGHPGRSGEATLEQKLWQRCRESARGGLETLAQRVESRASFDDVILPHAQTDMLRDIAAQLRHRHTVYESWGMAGKTVRGQGLCGLFTGESGTGKTLGAEAIANEVGLDLYRIDLATVVSKYIGETEKNLKRLFDGAEASGAVLLFDEADALFGKRSEVKDSHDRYANIE
ncbi:MAG: hypothetical protein QOF05_1668, partial [Sphingomonadales bacterium]|nr:hypothetical protein [Sphingomonadales bacterium]